MASWFSRTVFIFLVVCPLVCQADYGYDDDGNRYMVERGEHGDIILGIECSDIKGAVIKNNKCRCVHSMFIKEPEKECISFPFLNKRDSKLYQPTKSRYIQFKDENGIFTLDSQTKLPKGELVFVGENRSLTLEECGRLKLLEAETLFETDPPYISPVPNTDVTRELEYGQFLSLKLNLSKTTKKQLQGNVLNVTVHSQKGCNGSILFKFEGTYHSEYDSDIETISIAGANVTLIIACVIGIIGIVLIVMALLFYRRLKQREELYINPPPPYPEVKQDEAEHQYEYLNYQQVGKNRSPYVNKNSPYVNRPDIVVDEAKEQEPEIIKGPAFPRQNSGIPGDFYVNEMNKDRLPNRETEMTKNTNKDVNESAQMEYSDPVEENKGTEPGTNKENGESETQHHYENEPTHPSDDRLENNYVASPTNGENVGSKIEVFV